MCRSSLSVCQRTATFSLLCVLILSLSNGVSSFAPSSCPTKPKWWSVRQDVPAMFLAKQVLEKETTTLTINNNKDNQDGLMINTKELESGLKNCRSARQAKTVLSKVLRQEKGQEREPQTDTPLFDSISIPPGASAKGISDGDLAIQTRLANNKKYKIMELIELTGGRDADRASLAILCLTVGSSVSAIVANQNLPGPEILRFVVVWILSFAPLAFVGYGLATPTKLQTLLVSIQRELFPAYRQRMIQHEAGHFLLGHLLGLPVETYRANAVKNAVAFYPLKDVDLGQDRARQLGFDASPRGDDEFEEPSLLVASGSDAQYFGQGGRGAEIVQAQSVFRNERNSTDNSFLKLQSQNEPSEAWPYRGFDEATLDQLAVISVAGCCAEILAFGNAEGGLADFSQLRQIFASSEDEISDREADNRIRFALGYTMTQLRRHLGALDSLAAVMERDGSVAECVAAIETCPNVSGQDGISGDYERIRREEFRTEKAGLVERLFLGKEKNVDELEDRFVSGKGGGGRKEEFRLTGDDPLYAAVGAAFVFFVWASSGGLSLH